MSFFPPPLNYHLSYMQLYISPIRIIYLFLDYTTFIPRFPQQNTSMATLCPMFLIVLTISLSSSFVLSICSVSHTTYFDLCRVFSYVLTITRHTPALLLYLLIFIGQITYLIIVCLDPLQYTCQVKD